MEENELFLSDVKCEYCTSYYTAKTDDGRFHVCNNEDAKRFIKEIEPNFGCKYFTTRT